jgi:hypothetical protein
MKIDFGKVFNIVSAVGPLVQHVQSALKGKKGVEKHAAVADGLKELLPVIEGALGKDLVNDADFASALDQLIVAEKAVLTARERVAALIVKRK